LTKGRGDKNIIRLRLLGRKAKELGDEGYKLSVNPERIEIAANSEAGLFYGCQTLRQLLPTQIYRSAKVLNVEWTIPCVEITDAPRFNWRGGMLDTGRHFMPKEFVLKYIDLLAMHKLNILHLHLTEDQGWRIEIKRYPRLTEVGSSRTDTMLKYS